jgi:hypothetical protein
LPSNYFEKKIVGKRKRKKRKISEKNFYFSERAVKENSVLE